MSHIEAGPEFLVRCARCNSLWLHHYRTESWCRTEDAVDGTHVIVNQDGLTEVCGDMVGNPSTRRHGLSVFHICEQCNGITRMDIAQHKGQTRVTVVPAGERAGPFPSA